MACLTSWVLELSSFQLETTSTLKLDAAAMLNLSQDHLDRYATHGGLCGSQNSEYSPTQSAQVLNREDPASMAMHEIGKTRADVSASIIRVVRTNSASARQSRRCALITTP